MKKITLYIKKLVPWAVACAIFAYLFRIYPPSQVLKALGYVNIPSFVAFAVVYFIFIYLVDSWVMQRVISRFSQQVRFNDIFLARGVTYLVMILNYPASQAAFAYYLKRRYGIAIFEALGIFVFIVFVDILWIITLALAGSFFQDYTVAGIQLRETVQMIAATAYAFALVWLAFWRRWPEKVIGKHLKIPFIEALRKRRAFNIFTEAKFIDYLRVALMRTPIHLTIILYMYVIIHTFHASIPFIKILGNVPLIFFIGTLPITPGGLGTTNAATVELLSPYLTGAVFSSGEVTPKQLLFTATILWMFSNYLLKAITGTVMLRRISKDLFRPTEDQSEETVEEESPHIGGNY